MASKYSKAVVTGLEQIGFDPKRLHAATLIPERKIKSVFAGQGEFTDKELTKIEGATGHTGGQLAAHAVEPNGGALTDLLNQWATVAKLRPAAKPDNLDSAQSRAVEPTPGKMPRRRTPSRLHAQRIG